MGRTMSATDARVHFGEVMRHVVERGESVIVERGGETVRGRDRRR
jgi:prevent-host-death family protein